MQFKVYSISEAGSLLGISRQRVHQLIKSGKINSSKVGRINIITSDEIKRFKRERNN